MSPAKPQPKTTTVVFLVVSMVVVVVLAETDTFVFGGCSQLKYAPGTPYEQAVNSILTSIVNNAMFQSYNNFTATPGSRNDAVSGLFQCRGDVAGEACGRCVARAVTQAGALCPGACGGAVQLEGCFVKYDNQTFLGVEDKTVVVKKCGPVLGLGPEGTAHVDAVLDYMGGSGGGFRVAGSGDVQGVAQCVGDLSGPECQDCVAEALQTLRADCGPASSGDVYLAKCYARFADGGFRSHAAAGRKDHENNNNDDEIQKTLAILIGLIAGVALLIVFLSFLRKLCGSGGKGGK